MKKLFIAFGVLLITANTILAQVPQSFKYQAVVRDNAGMILPNQNVGIQISIHDVTAGGTMVYQETFSETTNQFGLVNLEIGNGTPVIGTFAGIDWGSGPKFIETAIDPSGSTGYVTMGTSQLLSVPYALYSDRSPLVSNEGSGNIFVGEDVAGNITTGYSNAYVGFQSGYNNSTGYVNSFLGYRSGYYNTIGGGNTFIGNISGYKNISGGLNTFIGDRCGYYNTEGGHNTYLGYKSGFSNSIGNENVCIGYKAGYYETGSNKLYINNNASSLPLIYGEFDNNLLSINGNVGIGTTNPSQKLEIYGNNSTAGMRVAWGASYPNLYGEFKHLGSGGLIINASAGGNWAKISFQTESTTKMFLSRSGNLGIGTISPASRLDVQGNVTIRDISTGSIVMELGKGLDYAEGFDVNDDINIEPGTILCIDTENPGKLKISEKAYDKTVAGIVAGANGLGSGIRLGKQEFDCDVALAGRVYCNTIAINEDIEPGDLLTTSSIPGYAMKVTDLKNAQGAVLGKAMERLKKGEKGQILVLVSLQ